MGGLSLTIVHVGRPKAPFVRAGIEHYRRRIRPLAALRFVEVRDEPLRKGGSLKELHRREAERLRKACDPRAATVVLDARSQPIDSDAFARLLEAWMVGGRSRLSFVVGGPNGLAPEIRKEADFVLSLSAMTLSHELALLVLLEQLYRALAVLGGYPYPR